MTSSYRDGTPIIFISRRFNITWHDVYKRQQQHDNQCRPGHRKGRITHTFNLKLSQRSGALYIYIYTTYKPAYKNQLHLCCVTSPLLPVPTRSHRAEIIITSERTCRCLQSCQGRSGRTRYRDHQQFEQNETFDFVPGTHREFAVTWQQRAGTKVATLHILTDAARCCQARSSLCALTARICISI